MLMLLIHTQYVLLLYFHRVIIAILLIKEQSTLKPREVRVNVHIIILSHEALRHVIQAYKVLLLNIYSSRHNSFKIKQTTQNSKTTN